MNCTPTGRPPTLISGIVKSPAFLMRRGTSQAEPVALGTLIPAVWSKDGVVVDLGEVRPVSRISFELNDAPWIAAPRLEVSTDGRSWEAQPSRASLADATLSSMREPRHGRGELRFDRVQTRFLRLDPRLPAAAEAFGVSP